MLTKKQKEQQAQDIAKSLLPLLPKITYVSEKEEYLQRLDAEERRRFLIREYFDKKKRHGRKKLKPDTPFCWIVLSKPFPQLFEYREEDEELFKEFSPIKFKFFRYAYHYYLRLLKEILKVAKNNSRASYYAYPVKLET